MTKRTFKKSTNALVVEREYERGWGSKDDAVYEFDSLANAEKYCKKVNARNTAPTAPDYYVMARVISDRSEFSKYEYLLFH